MAVVTLDRLTKVYDRTHAPAADAVSLDIRDGEFMVLLGPSGCGKTTTLRNPTLPAQVLAVLEQSPLPFRFAGGFFLLAPSLIVIFVIRRYLLGLWGRVAR